MKDPESNIAFINHDLKSHVGVALVYLKLLIMNKTNLNKSKDLNIIASIILMLFLSTNVQASDDRRLLVELPKMMQEHMLSNMRNHLETINKILFYLGNDEMDKAADIAEQRLGMSSLETHGASHMAKFMPDGMRKTGANMHRMASRFALKAQEGDLLPAYKFLTKVTSACVACHSAYKIR